MQRDGKKVSYDSAPWYNVASGKFDTKKMPTEIKDLLNEAGIKSNDLRKLE